MIDPPRDRPPADSHRRVVIEAIRPRSVVRCVTSPLNEGSIAFHTSIGFEVERIAPNYDGRGGDRVLFLRRL